MLLRSALFQLHWLLGLTAGLVLAIMGVSGAALSFEDEILRALNQDLVARPMERRPVLPARDLVHRIQQQRPDAKITFLVVEADPRRLSWVNLRSGARRETQYLDQTTGRLLGEGRGREVFEVVTRLHRWLALPGDGDGPGRQITGFAALSLIFFALSGLYLRWPKRPLDWRAWLVVDLRRSGRNLYRMLHAVVGGWVVAFYLLSATTGLYWSYGWYRQGVQQMLVGKAGPAPKGSAAGKAPDWRRAFDTFEHWSGEHWSGANRFETLTIATRTSGTIEFRGKLPGGRHDRVTDDLVVDAATGKTLKVAAYADRALGQDLITGVFELHRGAWFGLPGRIGVTVAALTMPLFTVTGLLLYLGRRRRKQSIAHIQPPQDAAPSVDAGVTIVAFASQTGTAERIARLTAQAIANARLTPLGDLDLAMLGDRDRLLIVASTYGEGEPPDMARRFSRRMAEDTAALPGLRFAVLALGDREYPDFCAFGRRLDAWLKDRGAQALQPLIQADGDDAAAFDAWFSALRPGLAATVDWSSQPMAAWRLVDRRLLNAGSSGRPIWHVVLAPASPAVTWTAGDIIEVAPQLKKEPGDAEPIKPRAYSIASLAVSGRAELLIRQHRAADGSLGLASGWLTQGAPLGAILQARIRPNPAFHPPLDPLTPLILIGNGSGLAGLLAHIRHRARAQGGRGPVWLLVGERHPDHDAHHATELEALHAVGAITRIDRAWSRLAGEARYVQDLLDLEAQSLAHWMASGATILVCGGAQGMAPAVDARLGAILGRTELDWLAETGRYRRDVY